MVVTVQSNRVLLAGNDIATAFPFTFKTYDVADIFCSTYDSAGVETVITQGVDFSVALNADGTGTVTYPISGDPLATNSNILIRRIVPNTQETNLAVNGPYDPASTMRGMDENTFKAIQNAEEIGRAPQFPANETGPFPLPSVDLRKGKFFAFDVGTGLPVAAEGIGATTDAALVAYTPPSGLAGRSVETRLFDIISSRDFVFGGVNDTAKFEEMLNAGVNKILLIYGDATYKLDQVVVPSNLDVTIMPDVVFEDAGNLGPTDRIFRLFRVSNVFWEWNGATVQGLGAGTYSGEQNHCVYIVGCNNVEFRNMNANDSGGDGCYVGSSGGTQTQRYSEKTRLINCNGLRNRRNNLTINSIIDCLVDGGNFAEAVGTNPQAGIDIEPNNTFEELQGLLIRGVKTKDNIGSGLIFAINGLTLGSTHSGSNNAAVLVDATRTGTDAWATNEHVGKTIINKTDGSRAVVTANTDTTITGVLAGGSGNDWDTGDDYAFAKRISIVVENHFDTGSEHNYRWSAFDDSASVITGQIDLEVPRGWFSVNGAFNIRNFGSNGVVVNINGAHVHNTNTGGGSSPKTHSPFSIFREVGDTGAGRIGNFNIDRARVTDDRLVPQTIAVLSVNDLDTTTPANEAEKIHFTNPVEMGGVAAATMIDFTGDGKVEDINDILRQSLTANTTIARSNYSRTYDNAAAGGQVDLTLDSDFTIGAPLMTFEVKAAQILRIEPGGSGSILPFGNGLGKYLQSSTIGHRITLSRTSATEWTVVDVVGAWTAEV